MATVNEANLPDLLREGFDKTPGRFFENQIPLWDAWGKNKDAKQINFKMFRKPFISERPGGSGWFLPSQSDFNAAKGMATTSMYIGVFYYALPMVFQGNIIRALKQNSRDAATNLSMTLEEYRDAAMKEINWQACGDGTAAVAFSSSTISSLGSATLNCTTAAATTSGQTKGAVRLQNNQFYDAINTSTGAIRGTFKVTAIGSSSCTITLYTGTISSGDPIVTQNSYQKAIRGVNFLVSDQSRNLQGLNTATYTDLNAPVIDLAGAVLTPFAFNNLRATIATRSNNKKKANNIQMVMTIAQEAQLAAQSYGLWRDTSKGADGMNGIEMSYRQPGVKFILDADFDEDRVLGVGEGQIERYEEMPFGEFDIDGQTWRMLMGVNNTGSDNYQGAIGMAGNLGINEPRYCGFIKRAAISGLATQVNSGAR